MVGTILDVINGGSIFLLIVSTGSRIVEQAVECRYMWDIVDGLDLSEPADLEGREVELAEDGLTVAFP